MIQSLAKFFNDGGMFMYAITAMGWEAAETIPQIEKLLSHKEKSVRYGAAGALGRFGPMAKNTVPALKKALDDPDPSVQTAAEKALASAKGAISDVEWSLGYMKEVLAKL